MSIKNVTNTSQATNRQSKRNPIKDQLMSWAHEGTKESIDKILDTINNTKDEDIKGFAYCAYEEASCSYYNPQNDAEEE